MDACVHRMHMQQICMHMCAPYAHAAMHPGQFSIRLSPSRTHLKWRNWKHSSCKYC